ncbi:MAG: hypothetical protein Q9159_003597 [Coniocarpon cinnabarinum]
MAGRPSIAPASNRQLSLTEELERLDQSITLTLQEIDANFSKAHRIVTSSIIPTVAAYGRHSDAVWQGSKFWKEFFEASANISLTGYEEHDGVDADANGDEATQTTIGAERDETTEASISEDVTERPRSRLTDELTEGGIEASSLMDSPSVNVKAAASATPRTTERTAHTMFTDEGTSSFAEYPPSPYEALKREMQGYSAKTPTTPGNRTASNGRSSPFKQTAEKTRPPNADPLLHRVLDQNYRIRATPHTASKPHSSRTAAMKDPTPQPTRTVNPALDSSPFSPAMEAPKLRAEIFGTPSDKKRKGRVAPTPTAPRTPGVSVQRPRSKSGFSPDQNERATARKTLFTGDTSHVDEHTGEPYEIDWDSGDDESAPFGGMSPPKTIRFNMPQSKLLQTPAREASKRIVDDLLLTAGGSEVTNSHDIGDAPNTKVGNPLYEDDDSPSVVRVTKLDVDDTF